MLNLPLAFAYPISHELSRGLIYATALAWADSHLVQPGKIDIGEAVTRYASPITAIMMPRLIQQRLAIAWQCAIDCHRSTSTTAA